MRKTRRHLTYRSSGKAGLVSVIVATRDRPQQLMRLLRSVRRQTYSRIEIIVVNDAHNSDIADLAKRYSVNEIIRTRSVGAAAAFNRGFLSSKGEFVIFSDDDQEWDRTMITKLVKTLKAHPSRVYAYCGFRNVEREREYTLGLLQFDPERILHDNYISGTSLIRRRKFIEAGMFDPSLKRLIDWDLWLSLLERGEEGILVPEVLFKHVHLSGPWISDDSNPNSLPFAIAHKLVEGKHSAFIESRHIENLMRADDPLVTLLKIYWTRSDLQNAFPEVKGGEYNRLIEWAGNTVATVPKETPINWLLKHSSWFTTNPRMLVPKDTIERYMSMEKEWSHFEASRSKLEGDISSAKVLIDAHTRELGAMKNELQTARTQLAELGVRMQELIVMRHELQGANIQLDEKLKNSEMQLDKARIEIENIRSSFGYRFMRFYASRIDRLCPNGTRRGRVRRRLVASLRARGRA
jgi:glycosyltransferase involved in cell wall biosynthesis